MFSLVSPGWQSEIESFSTRHAQNVECRVELTKIYADARAVSQRTRITQFISFSNFFQQQTMQFTCEKQVLQLRQLDLKENKQRAVQI